MTFADYALIFIIVLLLIFAVVFIKRQRKKGRNICTGCSGNCAECAQRNK